MSTINTNELIVDLNSIKDMIFNDPASAAAAVNCLMVKIAVKAAQAEVSVTKPEPAKIERCGAIKKPTAQQFKMHRDVSGKNLTIKSVAKCNNVSVSTVRRALDAVTDWNLAAAYGHKG